MYIPCILGLNPRGGIYLVYPRYIQWISKFNYHAFQVIMMMGNVLVITGMNAQAVSQSNDDWGWSNVEGRNDWEEELSVKTAFQKYLVSILFFCRQTALRRATNLKLLMPTPWPQGRRPLPIPSGREGLIYDIRWGCEIPWSSRAWPPGGGRLVDVSACQCMVCDGVSASGFLPTYDVVRQTYDIV